MHRCTREELIGQPIAGLTPSDLQEEVQAGFARLVSGEVDRLHSYSLTADGEQIPVEIRAARIEWEAEPALLLVVSDISNLRATERKLEEKSRELDAFMYRASHDLKGPLASIIGVTNIAQDEVADERAREYFQLIAQSTRRLDTILMDLIDITRLNQAEVQLEPINLKAMIQEVIDSLAHSPEAEGMEFQVASELTSPFVSDVRLMTSILQNLISNSINYRDPSKATSYLRIYISGQHDEGIFRIEDNGQGIHPRIREKVFDMFYRGNTKSRGSGLGLYIVKNAIEKLNGRLELHSVHGEGTTFTFRLPLLPPPAVEAPDNASAD
jgi:signal transduction histidine kinase